MTTVVHPVRRRHSWMGADLIQSGSDMSESMARVVNRLGVEDIPIAEALIHPDEFIRLRGRKAMERHQAANPLQPAVCVALVNNRVRQARPLRRGTYVLQEAQWYFRTETNERRDQEVWSKYYLPPGCRYPPDPAFVHAPVRTFLTQVGLCDIEETFERMGIYEVEDLITISLDLRNPLFHDEIACAMELTREEWGRMRAALERFVRPNEFEYNDGPECLQNELIGSE
ncbi:hypothetical protein BDZ89DRAFT_1142027 [Hymenopellis radicata]|nr:hypothetical protein BDZ89DRAFT_1142027 [Hymenopellis radicata]